MECSQAMLVRRARDGENPWQQLPAPATIWRQAGYEEYGGRGPFGLPR